MMMMISWLFKYWSLCSVQLLSCPPSHCLRGRNQCVVFRGTPQPRSKAVQNTADIRLSMEWEGGREGGRSQTVESCGEKCSQRFSRIVSQPPLSILGHPVSSLRCVITHPSFSVDGPHSHWCFTFNSGSTQSHFEPPQLITAFHFYAKDKGGVSFHSHPLHLPIFTYLLSTFTYQAASLETSPGFKKKNVGDTERASLQQFSLPRCGQSY